MSSITLVILSVAYLVILFFVAQWAENRQLLNWKRTGAYIYALSIGVYCSAWTFYGSIGRAATSGIDFLAIYIGPILVIPLWWILVRKISRIVKVQHITSLADFLASRYGKNQQIGTLVSILTIITITPYIALQLKAIGDSFEVISGTSQGTIIEPVLITTIALCVFTLIYGMRYLSGNEPKTGMVTAVALESLVKLGAFLIGGIALIWFAFGGTTSIFQEAAQNPELTKLFSTASLERSDWFWMMLVSGIAIILLPRQFQMAIIENRDERHLKKAMWLIPLYFLLINLFVLPIALAGRIHLPESIRPDYYFLNLTSVFSNNFTTGLLFFGGFSAATSMIIVSSLSLGNMLSTNVILPTFLRPSKDKNYSSKILYIRRASLAIIFILAYAYYHYLAYNVPLVSIGLTSFVGIAQLAPAFFGGLFWRDANRKGAIAGILSGFAIWMYALILPTFFTNMGWNPTFLESGFFSIESLSPNHFGAVFGLSPLSSTILISLLVNSFMFFGISMLTTATKIERNQAEIFVNIFKISRRNYDQAGIWQANVPFLDIKSLLVNFLGDSRTALVLDRYARINGIDFSDHRKADPRMISYAERLLTEAIGPASARIMIASVAKGEEISIHEVMDILRESKEVLQLNRELRNKHDELEEATQNLKLANTRLIEYSDIKDEFLYTVTHELRTPLTAIRAQAEILADEDDMPKQDQQVFLNSIVKECERLTNLITNVLDLEKFESGSQQLNLTKESLQEVINEAVEGLQHLMAERKIRLHNQIVGSHVQFYFDKDRIIQVMVNLISNAIKFCNPERGEIILNAYEFNNEIKVDVIDNGTGIKGEEVELVFDKFYQIKHQTRKKPTGSGLGLAICKNIIQMHGGKIWVQPEPNGGTRFSFTLPYRKELKHTEDSTRYEKDSNR